MPPYHKTSVTVYAHSNLGVDGPLGAYECVAPEWQLNVLLTHVPFGEETKDLLDALSLAYPRLCPLAPTIIIGDLNAAPTDDDRTVPPTATDIPVRDAMHQLPTESHRPHGRAHWLTLPLHPPSQRRPLPHRHVLQGPNYGARPRDNLRGPPARGHGPPTPLHRLHHLEPTPTRGHPFRRHPPTDTQVPGR